MSRNQPDTDDYLREMRDALERIAASLEETNEILRLLVKVQVETARGEP